MTTPASHGRQDGERGTFGKDSAVKELVRPPRVDTTARSRDAASGARARRTCFLLEPNVRIYGPIDHQTVRDFLAQIERVSKSGAPLVLELTTEGGDADAARRLALELRLFRKRQQEIYFVGKTVVMSAGATIMAAFPRQHRYLAEDAVLLIHERRLQKSLDLNGPIHADLQIVREMLAQLEMAQKLEKDGFAELAHGSKITGEELYERATTNLYLTARQALELELIRDVI
jgi:ATP-dependent protease ClpP protease subunit